MHLNQTLSGPIRSDSWIDLGGYAKQISAAMNGVVYAIGVDNAVYEYNDGGGWDDLGGYAKHIGAGVTSALGSPVVYAISLNGPVPFGNNIVGRAATRRGEGYEVSERSGPREPGWSSYTQAQKITHVLVEDIRLCNSQRPPPKNTRRSSEACAFRIADMCANS